MSSLFAAPVQSKDSDERYTPAWIFDGLGLTFDLDPASPGVGDFVPAARKLTRHDDGLAHDWHGRVWLNPPFSNATAWARRFLEHGCGVFLGPVANAAWAVELWDAADLVWFMRDLPFVHPTHSGKRSSMPLFMASMGADESAALQRLAHSGVHPGVLLRKVQP